MGSFTLRGHGEAAHFPGFLVFKGGLTCLYWPARPSPNAPTVTKLSHLSLGSLEPEKSTAATAVDLFLHDAFASGDMAASHNQGWVIGSGDREPG